MQCAVSETVLAAAQQTLPLRPDTKKVESRAPPLDRLLRVSPLGLPTQTTTHNRMIFRAGAAATAGDEEGGGAARRHHPRVPGLDRHLLRR